MGILTNSNIDPNTSDLSTNVETILVENVMMENHEIGANFQVRKLRRENSFLLTIPYRMFKRFVFAAKKRFRTSHPDESINLFINDNLISFSSVEGTYERALRCSPLT